MDERALQFRVGAMVVGTLLVAVLLLIVFNYSPSLLRGRDTIYIKFAQAPGITQDTPIRKSGVLIGRVSDVTLRERDVLITAKIDRKYQIYDAEICRIANESLLGDSMLEFVSYSPDNLGQPVSDGALLEGQLQSDAFGTMEQASDAISQIRAAAVEFRQFVGENREQTANVMTSSQSAIDNINFAAGKVGGVADQWSTLTAENEAQLARLITKSELAMDNFQLAMNNINALVGDEQMQANLKASIEGVPQLIDETRTAVAKYSAVADKADATLTETHKFSESLGSLGESSQQMAENIDAITEKVDRLVLDLLTMSDAINKQEGTLGQLIYDPELYQRLNRAADNVEQVSIRLRPVVEDVRVFSDKIARDPRQLGLRGALERNQTGNKFFQFGNLFRAPNTAPGQQYHWNPSQAPSPYSHPYDCLPSYESMPPSDVYPYNAYEQTSRMEPPAAPSSVQPAAHHQPQAPTAVPQWSPHRPARATSPQDYWHSR